MIKIEQFNLDTIDDIATMLLKSFKSKTVLFYGNMGVGKTTLINALLKALGSKAKATSPTFSIVNEYEVKDDIVYHFDFYRIDDPNEALDIGIEDYFYSGHWNFIEWPDKIDAFLPNEVDILKLKTNNNSSRALDLSVYDKITKIN